MKKNLVLIGPPGCGKGTQSAILTDKLRYNHVSTGNLLRAEIEKGTELGSKIKKVMDAGELVTDALVVQLLQANIDLASKQYIFDGFPRNVAQAKILDSEILKSSPYVAVYFDVDQDSLIERITNRRMTADGKHIYNLKTNPPKVAGICDVTGEKLIQREDDKEEVVKNRLGVYMRETEPMLDFYRKNDLLVEVDADQKIDSVTNQIIAAVS